jgi:hypothetical protein
MLDRGNAPEQPLERVEILQPGGGVRKLGEPTVLDRFLQQAGLQVLQPEWDTTCSASSYGFRPGARPCGVRSDQPRLPPVAPVEAVTTERVR